MSRTQHSQESNSYTKLLRLLDEGSIRYALLHGGVLLNGQTTSDLDLAIDPDCLPFLDQSLNKAYNVVQTVYYESSSCAFILVDKNNSETDYILADFITDYRWKGRIFLTAHDLFQSRYRLGHFWIVGTQQEFAYLLIKKIYEKGFIPEHQRVHLQQLVIELVQQADSIACALFGEARGHRVVNWISEGKWVELESRIGELQRALQWQMLRRDPLNPIRYWLPEACRLWRRCWYPVGLFVAVLGPDGAGKSTLLQGLRQNLGTAFRRTEVFHLRPGVVGKSETANPAINPHAKPPYPLWLSLLKIPYYLMDYCLGYMCKVRPKLVRSTLILFDRYYQDLRVDPHRYRYGGPPMPVRLASYLVPRPDLFLILDVPEDQLLARKQEVSPKELRRQRRAYWRLAAELPNAVILNGSLSPEEVARNARDMALDYLHARYLQRRHLWIGNPGWETLNWLSSIFFSGDKAHFGFSKPAQEGSTTQWKAHDAFGWLTLKDGRGFLIPLDSRQISIGALRLYNAQHWKARVAKQLLTISLRGCVSRPLLRKVQVLIRRDVSAQARGQFSLLEHLKEVLGRQDLAFAISLGTPGPHRKPVVQVLARDGRVLGYAKIGWNVKTDALVRHEADVLRRLAGTSFPTLTMPAVLYAGHWSNRFLCIQSAPEGPIETAPQRLTSQYLAVLNELTALHTRWLPLMASTLWTNLSKRIANIQSAYYRRLLQHGTSRVEAWLGHEPLPFHFCHGDLTPWNAQLLNGRLFLFDWEYADSEMPPGWDLLHFSVHTLWLLNKRAPRQICHAFRRNEMAGQWLARFLERLGVREEALQPLLLLYLVERLAFYASEDATNFQKLQHLAMMVHLCLFEEKSL